MGRMSRRMRRMSEETSEETSELKITISKNRLIRLKFDLEQVLHRQLTDHDNR
jgi:hypothetical protein